MLSSGICKIFFLIIPSVSVRNAFRMTDMSNLYFQSAFEYMFNSPFIAEEQRYPHGEIMHNCYGHKAKMLLDTYASVPK